MTALSRRKLLAATGATIAAGAAGCTDRASDLWGETRQRAEFRDTVLDGLFNVRPSGTIQFVLIEGLEVDEENPHDRLISDSGRVEPRDPDEFEWYERFVADQPQLSDAIDRLAAATDGSFDGDIDRLSGGSAPVNVDADADRVIAGEIVDAMAEYDVTDGASVLRFPRLRYTGDIRNYPGTVAVQLPDGQLHHYPPPMAGLRADDQDETDNPEGSVGRAAVPFDGGDRSVDVDFLRGTAQLQTDGPLEAFNFPITPTSYEEPEGQAPLELVAGHEVLVHPALGALASIWDAGRSTVLALQATVGSLDDAADELVDDVSGFDDYGAAAGFSPIGYPNRDRESRLTSYFPMATATRLATEADGLDPAEASTMLDLVSTGDAMLTAAEAFGAQSEAALDGLGGGFASTDGEGETDWLSVASIYGFTSSVAIQSAVTDPSADSLTTLRSYLDGLVGPDRSRPPLGRAVWADELDGVGPDAQGAVDDAVLPFIEEFQAGGTLSGEQWETFENVL